MTQVFAQDGTVTPATVVQAGPCVVLQAKGVQTDGYEAVQLGFVEEKPARPNKAIAGHYKKANVPPTRVRREVKVAPGGDAMKAGDQILVGGVFTDGDRVDVIGISRGNGFQGVMKRHHFRGGAATPRIDVPPRAGIDRRIVVSVARREGHARGRPDGRRSRDNPQRQDRADRRRQPPVAHPRCDARRGRCTSSSARPWRRNLSPCRRSRRRRRRRSRRSR